MSRIARSALAVVLVVVLTWIQASVVLSMDEPGFKIGRMVIGEKTMDREPVGVADTFSAATEKVYCFLEASDIKQDTEVTFVWYYGKKEMAQVPLSLRMGERWRTYASKRIDGLKGLWKVELLDELGNVLNSVSFTVE